MDLGCFQFGVTQKSTRHKNVLTVLVFPIHAKRCRQLCIRTPPKSASFLILSQTFGDLHMLRRILLISGGVLRAQFKIFHLGADRFLVGRSYLSVQ